MLSQFFVLSPRGDTIVSRDYRHDVSRSSHDAFFRALKFGTGGEEGDVAPVFLLDGVNYFHVKARPVHARPAHVPPARAAALGSLSHCAAHARAPVAGGRAAVRCHLAR